jgi:hypothetical protein
MLVASAQAILGHSSFAAVLGAALWSAAIHRRFRAPKGGDKSPHSRAEDG